jgi:hypothetical protein
MKTLAISLTIAALLAITAPTAAWSVGPGGGAGGHMGGFGGDASGHVGPVGRVGPGSPGAPLDHPGGIDRDGHFEHGGMLGYRDHLDQFGYPVCFAYPECASPCAWEGAGQPSVDHDSAETAHDDWVPPGCY